MARLSIVAQVDYLEKLSAALTWEPEVKPRTVWERLGGKEEGKVAGPRFGTRALNTLARKAKRLTGRERAFLQGLFPPLPVSGPPTTPDDLYGPMATSEVAGDSDYFSLTLAHALGLPDRERKRAALDEFRGRHGFSP